ncbi:hypothetical protein V6N13_070796 [Hibiscus sabdariffa]
MASSAAVPFWRAAGITYITYSDICANLIRNCLEEPHKTEDRMLICVVHLQVVHESIVICNSATASEKREKRELKASLFLLLLLPLSLPFSLSVSLKLLLCSFIYFSTVKDGRW